MNNQKDIKKTGINYSQISENSSNFSNVKPLSSMLNFEFANKKTEKLVTALYLVSDCMETEDPIKGKIRLLGVELLSDMYRLSTFSSIEKSNEISKSLVRIYELVSLIEIAYTIGFISEMNTSILKKEFLSLVSNLKSNQEKEKNFTFTLNEKMFDLPELNVRQGLMQMESSIKDKRTSFNTMSFMNNKSPFATNSSNSSMSSLSDRVDRTSKILALVKTPANGQIGVSIKDISLAFTDCSEKTIQRELNALVAKGQLKKTGTKRWSRYSVITTT